MKTKMLQFTVLLISLVLLQACHNESRESDDSSIFEVAGLNIKLPSEPVLLEIDLGQDGNELLKEYATYQVNDGGVKIVISRYQYSSDIELDFMLNLKELLDEMGADEYFKNVSGKIRSTKVENLDAGLASFSYEADGCEMFHNILEFCQGRTYWKIQIIRVDDTDQSTFNEHCEAIFASIKIAD